MTESERWNADQHFEKARKCIREALSYLADGSTNAANDIIAAAGRAWLDGFRAHADRVAELAAADRPEEVAWTIRQGIKTYRGGFVRALLKAHELGTILELAFAYRVADLENQERLAKRFPRIADVADIVCEWPMNMQGGIERAFPGFAALDAIVSDPTSADLESKYLVCAKCSHAQELPTGVVACQECGEPLPGGTTEGGEEE